jgi:hypothetical protein
VGRYLFLTYVRVSRSDRSTGKGPFHARLGGVSTAEPTLRVPRPETVTALADALRAAEYTEESIGKALGRPPLRKPRVPFRFERFGNDLERPTEPTPSVAT